MAKYLNPEDYLSYAKSLPVGAVQKFRHTCGSRESMAVGNDTTHYWAYCHRCGGSGRTSKQHVLQPVAPPPIPRQVPTDLRRLDVADMVDFGRGRILYDRWLVSNLSCMQYSPKYKRVYFPNADGTHLGYDVTGNAQASWYSPTRSCIIAPAVPNSVGPVPAVVLTSAMGAYFELCKSVKLPVMLVRNWRGAGLGSLMRELIQLGTHTVIAANDALELRVQLNVLDIEVGEL